MIIEKDKIGCGPPVLGARALGGGSVASERRWRTVQVAGMLGALGLWVGLWLVPGVALNILWNGIVPMAPALFVLATGLWRNLCPLGSISLLPRKLGLSQRRRVDGVLQARLQLMGVVMLLLVIPLRRVLLDLNGPATAVTLLLTAMVAVCLGCIFEWKSAWCAGACPVLAVETLYGSKPVKSFTNAHCASCQGCVMRCPDSLGSSAASQSAVRSKRLALLLMTGGFPGFVWGWMHVPDYPLQEGWHHLAEAYGLPAFGMAVSLLLFAGLRWLLPTRRRALLATLFAAASIIIYYWFRLPSLIGFSMFPNGDETLIDLRHSLPGWFPWAMRCASTLFFLGWFLRPSSSGIWMPRPRVIRQA